MSEQAGLDGSTAPSGVGRYGHVVVVRLDNAGDVLLAGPAVRAVAAAADRVTLVCGPAGRQAAELLPGVDRVVTFEAPWVPLEAAPFDRPTVERFVEDVRADRPDAAAVLTSFHQSPLPAALLLRMAGVAVIAASSEDHPGSLLDLRRRPEDDEGAHEVERSLRLVAMLGCVLPHDDDAHLAVRRPLPAGRPFAARYAVVHPGASVPARAVPEDRARELVAALAERGHHIVVTGGPSEVALAHRVAGPERPNVMVAAGATSLAELAGLLDAAAVVVTGNTGPAHVAAAVGTPVVSVFAPVVPAERWAPWRVPVTLLGDQSVACRGCRSRVCPFEGQPCLAPVTTTALLGAVTRWLVDGDLNGEGAHREQAEASRSIQGATT